MQQMQLKHLFVEQDPRHALIEALRKAIATGRAWAREVEADRLQIDTADADALVAFAAMAATRDLLDSAASVEARRLAGALKVAVAEFRHDGSDEAHRNEALLRHHAETLTALAEQLDAALDLRCAILAAADPR